MPVDREPTPEVGRAGRWRTPYPARVMSCRVGGPMARNLLKLCVACAVLAAGLLVAPAAQANYLAGGSDPAGDASDPSPARDIVAAALAYDRRAGTLRGGVLLRGAPDDASRAFVTVFAAVRTSSGCEGYPQIGVSSFTTDPVVRWTRFDGAGPPTASGDGDKDDTRGEVQMLEVRDRALAGRDIECVTAVLTDPADPNRVYDRAGPFALKGLPELGAKLGRTPPALEPEKKRTVRLTLHNPGDAATGRIRLSISPRRGLTAKAPRTVKALEPGQRRTVAITVGLSRGAKHATPLRITATAGKLRVRDEATLYLDKPADDGAGDDGAYNVCASYTPSLGGVGEIVTYPC